MMSLKKKLKQLGSNYRKNAFSCDNFEFEDLFTNLSNRSEVPYAVMLRGMLAYGVEREWSNGSADLSTAFLNAELNDQEDCIYLTTPPKCRMDLGIEEEHVVWKRNNALYGLKRAPKNGNSPAMNS